MDERMERVKNFVKEHKAEMACAAGAVACGVLVLALTGCKPSTKKTVNRVVQNTICSTCFSSTA